MRARRGGRGGSRTPKACARSDSTRLPSPVGLPFQSDSWRRRWRRERGSNPQGSYARLRSKQVPSPSVGLSLQLVVVVKPGAGLEPAFCGFADRRLSSLAIRASGAAGGSRTHNHEPLRLGPLPVGLRLLANLLVYDLYGRGRSRTCTAHEAHRVYSPLRVPSGLHALGSGAEGGSRTHSSPGLSRRPLPGWGTSARPAEGREGENAREDRPESTKALATIGRRACP